MESKRDNSPFEAQNFWIEVNADSGRIRIVEPSGDGVDNHGTLIIDFDFHQVVVPVNPILSSYPSIADTYSVYVHSIQTPTPLAYVGMTKRPWFKRYNEHERSALRGSPYLFHDALRRHSGKVNVLHRVLMLELDLDSALELEEEFVQKFGLYPLGLNMIPGGKAGLAYLSSLSMRLKSTERRAEAMESLMNRASINGRPNPLCSARWASDPDYAARIICGHSGRLTIDQVRSLRALSIAGHSPKRIFEIVGAKNLMQVMRVIAGHTYSRIQ